MLCTNHFALRYVLGLTICLLALPSSADEESAPKFSVKAPGFWTSSRIVGSPDPLPPFRTERVFPKLEIKQPIHLAAEPGSNDFIVVEHDSGWHGPSRIYRFASKPDVTEKQLLFETRTLIYAVEFHPDYAHNGMLFAFANGKDVLQEKGRRDEQAEAESSGDEGEDATAEDQRDNTDYDQILRFRVARDGDRGLMDGKPEVIIRWPSRGHDGGDLAFGPDGMLYIGSGDGSGSSDSRNSGQTLDNLRSTIVRINVDQPTADALYSVPEDNPFIGLKDARPEIWAYGLRNPWRVCYDAKTNQLWAGNNGQDLWESVYLIQRGGNYGWPLYEGNHPFQLDRELGPTPIVSATIDHSHAEARSLTGGEVYHGKLLEMLQGAYVYGDFSTGKIWAARHDQAQLVWHQEIASTRLQITCFALDHQNELLVLDHAGAIYRLVPQQDTSIPEEFPTRLSESGIFRDTARNIVEPVLVPYSVNAPQWLDGAIADRWIGLPFDLQIDRTSRRAWKFPDLSVLVQTISMDMVQGDPASRRKLETRLLTRQEGEWVGYTYRWNREQTDADLVAADGDEVVLEIDTPAGTQKQLWRFPGRAECIVCHNRAVDYLLGLTTTQMNRLHDYDGHSENQLELLDRLQFLDRALPSPAGDMPALIDPRDTSADMDKRARSYLHANCHHCHVHEGGGNSRITLEYGGSTTRSSGSETYTLGQLASKPVHGNFDLYDALVAKHGSPEESVLYFRMAKTGPGRMPYAGSNLVDTQGLDLVYQWIAGARTPEDKKKFDETESAEESEALASGQTIKVSESKPSRPVLQNAVREQPSAGQPSADQPSPEGKRRPVEPVSLPKPIIEQLLRTTSGGIALQRMVDIRSVTEATRQEIIKQGLASSSGNVRQLFERFLPFEQQKRRLGPNINPDDILKLRGDPARGKSLFFAGSGLQCKTCHGIGGDAVLAGPDLASVGKKFRRSELLESILQPSKKIDEKYRLYQVITDEGTVISGTMESRSDDKLVMRDAQSKRIELAADQVEEIISQDLSLMPTLLLQNLTAQEAADLLDFLTEQKADLATGQASQGQASQGQASQGQESGT